MVKHHCGICLSVCLPIIIIIIIIKHIYRAHFRRMPQMPMWWPNSDSLVVMSGIYSVDSPGGSTIAHGQWHVRNRVRVTTSLCCMRHSCMIARKSFRWLRRVYLPAAFNSRVVLIFTACWRRHSVVNWITGMLTGKPC